MKAVLCYKFGPPESLKYDKILSPEPGENEIVISVKVAGVNFPDTLIIQGKYQFKPEFPFSPGGEVSAEYAPEAAQNGCLVIDNTSYFYHLMVFIINVVK